AILADGWHLRTDVYTSLGVMVGLGLIMAGGRLFPGVELHWIDPVMAIFVALLIVKAAYVLTKNAIRDLLDTSLPASEQEWLHDYLSRLRPTVRSYHRLRTRKAGPARFIDMHLTVDPDMSVEASHQLTDKIESEVGTRFPGADVLVHIEPCDGSCDPSCVSGCLLTAEEQRTAREEFQRRGGGAVA
ncbi:MAG: cation diffusion facilitator family transporter, partial [Dehalococcoidia bacterium]